jgi:hypothetical protein
MKRAPNPNSPEEVRRAIQATQVITDSQAGGIALLNTEVTAIQGDVTVIDGRLDVLESMESDYESVADSNVAISQPLYLKNNGHVGLAKANSATTFRVSGLAFSAVLSGHVVKYNTNGRLTIPDWTAIAGTASLTPGAYYYLSDSTAGMITSIAPTSAGSYVACIGRAASTVILDIEIEPSILL